MKATAIKTVTLLAMLTSLGACGHMPKTSVESKKPDTYEPAPNEQKSDKQNSDTD